MTWAKRWRVIVAAWTQDWHEHRCKCGTTQWVEGPETWSDPSQCIPCETAAFEDWREKYNARQRQQRQEGVA